MSDSSQSSGTPTSFEIPKDFDQAAFEEACRNLWEDEGIYKYNPDAPGEIFSVDTPPPYVSAAHLHVGHAMSYTQAEIIIRYQRMKGRKVFYPMGFDDNGLPTERFVESKYKINKRKTTRSDFRKLCLDETREGAKAYEQLWRALGLSVDWNQRYSTIDDHCRKTSQKSFLDLYRQGRIYRSEEPVLWDTHFETALAQADLETISRKGRLNDIAFKGEDGSDLIISTTRPELIPACVGLYCNPEDERYKHLVGKKAIVPLSGREVPILTDEEVKLDFGTGLMMVCTFGDGEDVKKWKRDNLELRLILDKNGRMNELAGPYQGKTVEETRKLILKDLKESGDFREAKNVEQNVSVAERSGVPVEFNMAPQWFIRVLDLKDELLKRSEQLNWNPSFMKVRLDDWITGLKYDWNISRQRFYGVPIPLWRCESCGEIVVAEESQLPVDPLEDKAPVGSCPSCQSESLIGEADVLDTWMTSSLTPLVNANWAESPGRDGTMDLHPMTVRVQAFEIIRTWLFYTVVKSHCHINTIPWTNVMISGWGLNEQGKKISKRDLEKHTDADGYNRYEPYAVIQKFGADALRYWAASSNLGSDTRFNEREVKNGRRLVVKLWNAARFVGMQLEGFDPKAARIPVAERTPEDRWLLSELHKSLPGIESAFEAFNYAPARESIDRFFWNIFADNYLEMVKDRFWHPERYDEKERDSARATLWESLRALLSLYAPFVPFVTEELYQRIFRPFEEHVSLHVSPWPQIENELAKEVPEMATVLGVLQSVRVLRTQQRLSQNMQLSSVTLDLAEVEASQASAIKSLERSLGAVLRTGEIKYGAAENSSEIPGLRIQIEAPEKDSSKTT